MNVFNPGPLTEDDVHHAADQLVAENIKPTQKNIRAALGLISQGLPLTEEALEAATGRGSITTISKAMTSWHAARLAKPQPRQVEIPDAVTRAGQTFLEAVWEAATTEAAAAVEAAQAELRQVREQSAATIAEASAVVDGLEAQQGDLDAQLHQERARASEIAAERDAARKELHAVQVETARLQERLAERDAGYAETRAEIGALRAAHDELRTGSSRDLATAEAAVARIQADLDRTAAEMAAQTAAYEAGRETSRQEVASAERARQEAVTQAALERTRLEERLASQAAALAERDRSLAELRQTVEQLQAAQQEPRSRPKGRTVAPNAVEGAQNLPGMPE